MSGHFTTLRSKGLREDCTQRNNGSVDYRKVIGSISLNLCFTFLICKYLSLNLWNYYEFYHLLYHSLGYFSDDWWMQGNVILKNILCWANVSLTHEVFKYIKQKLYLNILNSVDAFLKELFWFNYFHK